MSAWQELHTAWSLVWANPSAGLPISPMTAPWALALALAWITLLVEDVAIAAGAALAAAGILSWEWAFAGVAGGIASGDIALYGLGFGAHRIAWLQKRWFDLSTRHPDAVRRLQLRLDKQLPSAILLARVIPGLRLLTYTACGWLRVDLLRFSLWCCLAVTLWTAGLFYLSATVGEFITQRIGLSPAIAAALPVLAFALAVPAIRHVQATYLSKKKEAYEAA
jgi:membrane protein DedA with SNARE-associated domain